MGKLAGLKKIHLFRRISPDWQAMFFYIAAISLSLVIGSNMFWENTLGIIFNLKSEQKTYSESSSLSIQSPSPSSNVMNNIVSNGINLNEAEIDDLTKLPGIGAAKAAAILEYRYQIGRYTEIEQLLEVKGIGEKIFEKIKKLVVVE